jgi:predicted HTH transcriptional regulator
VCAFANALGGFYIIGASREKAREPWKIDPVDFGGEEPGT